MLHNRDSINDLLDSLIVHLRALDMRRYGVGEEPELAHVCRGGDIEPLCVIVHRRVRGRERGGKATVECRVQELGRLGKHNLSEVVKSQAGLFHCVGHGHRLEVSAVVDMSGLAVNKRVIGSYSQRSDVCQAEDRAGLTRVALLGDNRPCVEDVLELGSDKLRRSTERVTVLAQNTLVLLDRHLLLLTALRKRAALEQVPNLLSRLDLARVGASDSMDKRMVGRCTNLISVTNLKSKALGTNLEYQLEPRCP